MRAYGHTSSSSKRITDGRILFFMPLFRRVSFSCGVWCMYLVIPSSVCPTSPNNLLRRVASAPLFLIALPWHLSRTRRMKEGCTFICPPVSCESCPVLCTEEISKHEPILVFDVSPRLAPRVLWISPLSLHVGPQDVTVPIITTPEYLWWAHTWHMQTPLETLGAGSFVAFELKEKVLTLVFLSRNKRWRWKMRLRPTRMEKRNHV